jgi:hypothetical protein
MTNRHRALLWATSIAVLFAVLSFERVNVSELVITGADGSLLAVVALPKGRFDHVFIHSVHQTPVAERFRIETTNGRVVMHLYELRYQSQGVGMPADAEGGYRLEGDHFILSMDRTFEQIPIMVSPIAGHGIVTESTFTPFVRLQQPGHRIVLSARTSRHIRLRRYHPNE